MILHMHRSKPDMVLFGGIRINEPSTKFFQVLYIGESVSPLKKGKAQLHKSAIFNAMPGCSGEISIPDLSAEKLKERIAAILKCAPDAIR